MTDPTTPEARAWAWLDEMVGATSDEHPSDIAYSADQMVDAFIAGSAIARPSPQASAVTDEMIEAGVKAWRDPSGFYDCSDAVREIYAAMSALAEPRVPSEADRDLRAAIMLSKRGREALQAGLIDDALTAFGRIAALQHGKGGGHADR